MISIIILALILLSVKMFRIIPAREVGIKERFGKYSATLQPGFHFLIPIIDQIAYRHEMREQVIDVPPQTCITKDNVQVEVDGVIYLKVMDPYKTSYGIENYYAAAINLAQTTMRSEMGKLVLDDTFKERDKINENIVKEIDKAAEPWGIKFIRYEIRNIDPTQNMIDTMERQMEAERHKRAEITLSQGDREARKILSEGEKKSAINISEGEKLKRINEAEGKAAQIELVAKATGKGIDLVSKAIQNPGGKPAVKMQIMEEFIEEFGKILNSAKVSVLPADLANIRGIFEGISKITLDSNFKESKQKTKEEK